MFQDGFSNLPKRMLPTARQVIASKRHPKKHTYPGSLFTPILFLLSLSVSLSLWFLFFSFFLLLLWFGCGPLTVTVTTKIITCLIGNPYKPSFTTVTVRGPHPSCGFLILAPSSFVFFPTTRFKSLVLATP